MSVFGWFVRRHGDDGHHHGHDHRGYRHGHGHDHGRHHGHRGWYY